MRGSRAVQALSGPVPRGDADAIGDLSQGQRHAIPVVDSSARRRQVDPLRALRAGGPLVGRPSDDLHLSRAQYEHGGCHAESDTHRLEPQHGSGHVSAPSGSVRGR